MRFRTLFSRSRGSVKRASKRLSRALKRALLIPAVAGLMLACDGASGNGNQPTAPPVGDTSGQLDTSSGQVDVPTQGSQQPIIQPEGEVVQCNETRMIDLSFAKGEVVDTYEILDGEESIHEPPRVKLPGEVDMTVVWIVTKYPGQEEIVTPYDDFRNGEGESFNPDKCDGEPNCADISSSEQLNDGLVRQVSIHVRFNFDVVQRTARADVDTECCIVLPPTGQCVQMD